MPISVIFLLPIDYVSHNAVLKIDWFDLSDKAILYLWKTNYWVTFLLTWFLFPILQEFYKSGYYKSTQKLKDALKRNLKFQLIVLGVSVAALIYLVLEVGLTNNLRPMIIAIAHIYSLTLALWLMAHGLVNIPRNKWVAGSIVLELNHKYLKVPGLVDALEDTRISFRENIIQVMALKRDFASDQEQDFRFRDWILSLYNQIPLDLKESIDNQYLHERDAENITREQLTESLLVNLSVQFGQNKRKTISYESEFESIFNKILKLEDILNAKTNSNLSERNSLVFRRGSEKSLLLPRNNFIYHYYVRPVANRVISVLIFVASFIIIQSEIFHSHKFSIINMIFYSASIHKNNLLQLLLTCFILSYMLFAAMNSLTHVKVFNMYHLVPHNSDPSSACFYTSYIARLTIPLSYNFITLFVSRESIFETWFGKSIHLTGLFNLMNDWLPRLLLIPIILSMFNIYDKLKKKIGLDSTLYDSWALFDDEALNDNRNDIESMPNKRKDLIIVEAKRLVSREWTKRQQQMSGYLRPYNIVDAANMNYESNRRNFHSSLASPYEDSRDVYDNNLQERSSYSDMPSTQSNLWGRLGTSFTGIKDTITNTFSNHREYRDDPIEGFDYDDDANENLIL